MRSLKVLVLGTASAGKTTFIKNLSEIPSYVFEYPHASQSKYEDEKTSLLEFGRITVNESLAVQLFATNLDLQFIPVWKRLQDGLIGAIILLDGTSQATWNENKDLISQITKRDGLASVVILTKVSRSVSAQRATEAKNILQLPSTTPLFVWNTAEPMVERRILAELCKNYLQIKTAVAG